MMEHFSSLIRKVGDVSFPKFSGIRILIMPYHLHDPAGSLPEYLQGWVPVVESIGRMMPVHEGIAYLTIDEAEVLPGETHRRPGIHVDGVGPDRTSCASWSSSGGDKWASPPKTDGDKKKKKKKKKKKVPRTKKTNLYLNGGMYLASSHIGCQGWDQVFDGYPEADGDCVHLAPQCQEESKIIMQPGGVYWCGHLAVHEALPMVEKTKRQFVRISMPSDLPWYAGCTPNPLGIMPEGPIAPRRDKYMAYRP